MRKIITFFTLLLVFCLVTMTQSCSCNKKDDNDTLNNEVKVTSIVVDNTTLPEVILTTDVDSGIEGIKIKVTKSNGDVENIKLEKSMLSSEDLLKLSQEGTQTVTITYSGKTTTMTITVDDPSNNVTVSSIEVVETTVPSEILITEVDTKFTEIKLKVNKSDNTTEEITLSKSMLSTTDLTKLSKEGMHTLTISYEGCTTTLELTIEDPSNDPVEKIDYSVVVKDIAGKPLVDFYVTFWQGNSRVAEGYTDINGTFTASLESNIYEVEVEGREGYWLNQTTFETDFIGSVVNVESEIDSLADIEAEYGHGYELGDVMYDFKLTNTEGTELDLYDLLEEYDVVLLNFWYTTCSACFYEFPYMKDAYNSTYTDAFGNVVNYSDKVCIIAVNPGTAGNGDTLADITSFKQSQQLPFNVAMDYDANENNLTLDPALTNLFAVEAYPTTVVIDRYGLIADIEVGSITSLEKWTQTFDKYIADDYTPVYTGVVEDDDFIKPDIEQSDSSVLEDAANGTNYDGTDFTTTYMPEDNENDKEYSWPWVVDEYLGVKCIRPSNKDVNPSFSIVYLTVELKVGEVFTFDYFSSTESYDILYVIVDNTIVTQIAGKSTDWETSFAYAPVQDGTYEIGFCYMKDSSYSEGEDAVFVSNIRIEETSSINKPTYIYREASYGDINEFFMEYEYYITAVYNEEDGYYHVGSQNGPLLFADLLSGTNWNSSTLYEISLEGNCIGADEVDYNKLIEKYAVYASNSTIGYTPVTKELADGLKQIVKALGDDVAKDNPNQWLEVCCYYSSYGTDGSELGIPTTGVCPFEPIMFDGDGILEPAKAEAEFNRIILPRGFIFGFTPSQSGVYKFYSTEEELETLGWICDADGNVIGESDYELRIFAEQTSKGQEVDLNFVAYVYLEEGQTYLFRAAFYDVYEYSTITVEMKYVDEKVELLTIASPGFFTSSDDEMSDIISGNYCDVYLAEDGFYHVKDSKATDTLLYCDVVYINNILSQTIENAVKDPFYAFDFSKNEYGYEIFDEEGYYREVGYDEEDNLIRYYVCYDSEENYYYVKEVGENGYTEANGYTYVRYNEDAIDALGLKDYTEYVTNYIAENMITDETSELYGCVKVNEQFAKVLGHLMDKYTFEGIEYSWVKLCYYYKYIGPVVSE